MIIPTRTDPTRAELICLNPSPAVNAIPGKTAKYNLD
jgi:hypothetical protein